MTRLLEFRADDLAPVVAAVAADGWVNLQPEVGEDAQADDSVGAGLFAFLGARGPVVPFATWHAGERSAGIQHGTGPKLARRVAVPDGWRVVQDHPRRGLVVRVPPGVADGEVLRWLVALATELCPLPLTGRWVAELHP